MVYYEFSFIRGIGNIGGKKMEDVYIFIEFIF